MNAAEVRTNPVILKKVSVFKIIGFKGESKKFYDIGDLVDEVQEYSGEEDCEDKDVEIGGRLTPFIGFYYNTSQKSPLKSIYVLLVSDVCYPFSGVRIKGDILFNVTFDTTLRKISQIEKIFKDFDSYTKISQILKDDNAQDYNLKFFSNEDGEYEDISGNYFFIIGENRNIEYADVFGEVFDWFSKVFVNCDSFIIKPKAVPKNINEFETLFSNSSKNGQENLKLVTATINHILQLQPKLEPKNSAKRCLNEVGTLSSPIEAPAPKKKKTTGVVSDYSSEHLSELITNTVDLLFKNPQNNRFYKVISFENQQCKLKEFLLQKDMLYQQIEKHFTQERHFFEALQLVLSIGSFIPLISPNLSIHTLTQAMHFPNDFSESKMFFEMIDNLKWQEGELVWKNKYIVMKKTSMQVLSGDSDVITKSWLLRVCCRTNFDPILVALVHDEQNNTFLIHSEKGEIAIDKQNVENVFKNACKSVFPFDFAKPVADQSSKHYSIVEMSSQAVFIEDPLTLCTRQHTNELAKILGYESNDFIQRVLHALDLQQSILLVGEAGTGKSKMAKCIAHYFTNGDENRFSNIQLSQTTCYGDFIGGATVDGSSMNLAFLNKRGFLLDLIAKAHENKFASYWLVIDELNRGNTMAIIGELLNALDRDGPVLTNYRENRKQYKLELPSNLYIIATANETDKSVLKMDDALVRRFKRIKFESSNPIWIFKGNEGLKNEYGWVAQFYNKVKPFLKANSKPFCFSTLANHDFVGNLYFEFQNIKEYLKENVDEYKIGQQLYHKLLDMSIYNAKDVFNSIQN